MRISDWSSDVCSSDLFRAFGDEDEFTGQRHAAVRLAPARQGFGAINLATRHTDDRLEERHELALPQTAAYLPGQCQLPAPAMGMAAFAQAQTPGPFAAREPQRLHADIDVPAGLTCIARVHRAAGGRPPIGSASGRESGWPSLEIPGD